MNSVDLKAEGNKAFAKGEYKKAAKIYRDAIGLDSKNAVLYSNRSQCFLKLGDFDRALKDTVGGLQLTTDTKLLTKLHFRKGLALKGLGDLKSAKTCFDKVLLLDGKNNAAIIELQDLVDVRKRMKLSRNPKIEELEPKSDIPIKIDEVDVLSERFQKLLARTDPPVEQKLVTTTIELEELVTQTKLEHSKPTMKEAPSNTKPTQEAKSKNINDTLFVERLSMHFLAGLKSLPESQKLNAYKYVLTIAPSEYQELFGSSGIDHEYLEFFLEAVANSPQDAEKSLISLTALSKFRRFQLSLDFCDIKTIHKILNNLDGQLLQDYKAILS